MDAPIAPLPPMPSAPKAHTTLGSLGVAMLIGALVAVAILYFWGAQVAKEEGLSSDATEEAR